MKPGTKNILSSILPQVVNIVTNLILPGLIVITYGSEINGLVSTAKSIIAYISLVGAGIAVAVTQAFYSPIANKDLQKTRAVLKAANKMFTKYGNLFCIITILVALVYPLAIKSDFEYTTMVLILVVVSISGASEFYSIGKNRALLYANQKVYVCSIVQAISLFVGLVLALFIIKMKGSIILVQLSISLVYALRGVFLSLYVRKNYPEYLNYKETTLDMKLLSKRGDAMIHQLSSVVVVGSQSLILSLIVGLKAASIFAIYNIVFAGLQSICANISNAVTPFLGREVAKDSIASLKKLYDVIEYSFFSIAIVIYSVAAIMLSSFIELYTQNADINYVHTVFGYIFIISSAFYIIKMPSCDLLIAAGHFKETRWQAVTEAIISVVVGIILTILIGKEGVLIGSGLALAWRSIVTIKYTNKRILKADNKKSFIRLAKVFLFIVTAIAVSEFIKIDSPSFLQWVINSLVVTVIVLLIVILESLLFEREPFKYVMKYIFK